MLADTVNALFSGGATLALLLNCRALHRDKAARGVSLLAVLFFSAWGWWMVFYLCLLEQWASVAGACANLGVNMLYVGMLVVYSRRGAAAEAADDAPEAAVSLTLASK